ncbi:MAG: translation elongation factor P [Acidobacteriia bacterium]|nr:translation elongation factor P [Terriglobia bacterium]
MVLASQLRAGMAIQYQKQDYKVIAAEYHPGQGQMGGSTHARLQSLDTGTFWEHSFRADLRLEEIPLQRQALEFLYADSDQCYFMNPETFEQTEIARALVGPQASLLEPGMKLSVEFVGGRPVSVLFPEVLEVKIVDTAAPMHQQQDNTFKPAKLENGVEVMVPQFIKTGDLIRISAQNLKYMDRVKAKHG